MSRLIIEDVRGRKTTVPLSRDELTLGRDEGNTIRLTERDVSRRHLRVVRREGRLYAEDSSRYGSLLNGRRFTGTQPLLHGDVITLGDYRLTIECEPDEPGNEPPTLRPEEPGFIDLGTTRLIGRSEELLGRTWVLTGSIVIGTEGDIRVPGPGALARHARIEAIDGAWHIRVIDPAATLRINGSVQRHGILRRGDLVTIGAGTLRFITAEEFFVSQNPVEVGSAFRPPPPPSRRGPTAEVKR